MRIAIVLFLAVMLSACGFETVDTGHRGVQVRFGKVDEKLGSLPEDIYFYNPFTTSIYEIDTRTQKLEGTANTYTKDVQQANIKFVVNYSLERDAAHIVFRDVGRDWAPKLIPQAIEGVLKQIVGQYDATDLISSRAKATAEIQKAMAESLKTKNVIIERFEMVNIQYQQAYESAVESKVVAIQRAIEEANKTKQVQEQAKQQVISAQAEAESMRIRANALASNPKLVEWEMAQAAKKWDGKLPDTVMGNAIPFIQLPAK